MYTCLCPTQFADLVRHALQILSSGFTFSSLCIYRKKINGDDGAKGTAAPPRHTALLGLRPKSDITTSGTRESNETETTSPYCRERDANRYSNPYRY
jgi:hypothetical protein